MLRQPGDGLFSQFLLVVHTNLLCSRADWYGIMHRNFKTVKLSCQRIIKNLICQLKYHPQKRRNYINSKMLQKNAFLHKTTVVLCRKRLNLEV